MGVEAAESSNGEGLARDEAMIVALLIEVADGVSGVKIDIKRGMRIEGAKIEIKKRKRKMKVPMVIDYDNAQMGYTGI